jgi:PAS domain S-box-containing protein
MVRMRHARAEAEPAGRWLALALAAFALLAAVLFAIATLADRRATLAQGRTDAENTAALLAAQADRALRVAELTTARLADLARREGLEALRTDRWGKLAALDEAAREIASLWVLDARGRLVASSVMRDAPPVDLSDRDYFTALRDGADDHLSGLAFGRLVPVWFAGLSTAIRQDGELRGVVGAALHAEDLARVADGLDLGPGAELRVARTDGVPVMVWPLPAAGLVLPGAVRASPRGLAEEAGADGVVRLVAWRAAPSVPVVAVAALSRDHVLAPFRRRLQRNGLIFALSLALAGGLGLAALRAERRGAEARRAAEERGGALGQVLAERTRLLASLQEGEARLRLAQQAGGIGLWDLDLQSGRIGLAGEVFGAWGLPSGGDRGFRTLPVRAALRGIRAEDRAALLEALSTAVQRGLPLAVEFRVVGRVPERWIGVRAEVQAGPGGQARRLVGIALDVTAARAAQHALEEARVDLARRVAERTGALAEANARLREGEARFRGVFNATFEFIGLLSQDGTVLEANAAMLRLGGAEAAEVVGQSYWDAPWWPADPATQALVRSAVAAGGAGTFVRREATMRDRAGRPVAVDFSVTPVRDEDGLVSLLVAEARDVSALKAAQALLHEAQKMDTLGQLTGGVAHDFNNLLMAVLGNLGVARRRLQGQPELRRHLDAAVQAAERGAVLTQRLLAFARRQDLEPQPVDLRALLLGVEALLRRSAGPLVTLRIDAPEGLPAAEVDPHALELALVNLAVNARDAMPEGGELQVRLARPNEALPGLDGAGRWLALSVADTGEGMDEATLSRAVEPFFTTKGPGRGTGLGLSMVHGLAAQSGGALQLRSAPGEGTTATLWLPVSTLRPPVTGAAAEPSVQPGPGGTVLVVDDEALVLESTAAMVEELGYDTLRAASAEEALKRLAARPDVAAVLTDHAMPGMTGAALAAKLRAERPGLPVILATGFAGAWAEEPGGPPRLAKPYTLAQLSDALGGALARAAE